MPIQIVISVSDDGKFNVTGPLDDSLKMYGLLELAKDAVRKHHERRVQVADVLELSRMAGAKS